MSPPPDVAIIGGGIVGCAAAAFLAEAGARVELFETGVLAGAASGRNSGALQHPFDGVLAELHAETMDHIRELDGLTLPAEPSGLVMVSDDRAALAEVAAQIARETPELRPELLGERELRQQEPSLAPGLQGCRLETGWPVRPSTVTLAFAERARRAGAHLREDSTAWPWMMGSRAHGVLADGVRRPADQVLVAAGPWTPEVVDTTGAWRPIAPLWGVVVEVRLSDPPRQVVEELGVEDVVAGTRGAAGQRLFSAVTARGVTSVGTTLLEAEPDPEVWVESLLAGAARYLPTLARTRVGGVRACARPQSFDGRPLVGEMEDTAGLWVAAGHGPWGISTGAATARLVADALLDGAAVPPALAVARSFQGITEGESG